MTVAFIGVAVLLLGDFAVTLAVIAGTGLIAGATDGGAPPAGIHYLDGSGPVLASRLVSQ